MKINSVSAVNPAFNARFIPDNKGLLEKFITESYYTNQINENTSLLADKFNKLGKNQKLIILEEYRYDYKDTHEHGLKILNQSTGKIGYFYGSAKKPFWDCVLDALIRNEKFYKTDTNKSKVFKSLLNG